MNAREQARQAVILAYRHRITGALLIGGSEVMGKPVITYEGDFPYQEVADTAPLPRPFTQEDIGKGLQSIGVEHRAKIHKKARQQLYALFDREWQGCLRTAAA